MSSLSFIERKKISNLLNKGGYVLDFKDRTYAQFMIEKVGVDFQAKYGLSKGKTLEAIMERESDITAGKVLVELLLYMKEMDLVNDENRELFVECAEFGNRLVGRKITPNEAKPNKENYVSVPFNFDKHLSDLVDLSRLDDTPQARGYAFERYLYNLFLDCGLEPREAFKINRGEQIDGSFVLRNYVFLLEAKWTSKEICKSKLGSFRDTVNSKSSQTRGLYISFSEYTEDAINSFGRGASVSVILMTVQELAISLQKKMPLEELLWIKLRALAEEGDYYKKIQEIV